ncbi:MAG: hypothetical protein K2M30_04485 [Desulfovibrionaceae bacterium]|nr:hypothetical protein [Desulfovibrionaceae bacterium]
MSIENVLKEYLAQYGVHEVQFSAKGMFSTFLENIGLLSCEQIPDGLIIALFQEIAPSQHADFMKRALQYANPKEQEFPCRPVLYSSQAGVVTAIQNDDISLSVISTRVDSLFRALQNALRV